MVILHGSIFERYVLYFASRLVGFDVEKKNALAPILKRLQRMREDVATQLRQEVEIFHSGAHIPSIATWQVPDKKAELQALGIRISEDNQDMKQLFEWMQPDLGFSEVKKSFEID